MLRSASDVLATGDVGQIVDFAIEANRTASSATRELGIVKGGLRALAEEEGKRTSSSSVRFEGNLGVAHVVIPKPVYRARKGMRLGELRKVLSDETYETLFVEKVVVDVGEDFEDGFADLSPSQRLVVEKFVESVPQTARVNLPE
jgi:hypothetical protein